MMFSGSGRVVTATVFVLSLAACGEEPLPQGAPSTERVATTGTSVTQAVDAAPTASATPPAATGSEQPPPPASAVASSWIDITSNLVGLDSSCGNVSYISAHPAADQVIAGIALNGLWQLNSDSSEWSRLGQGQGSAEIRNRTTWIEYDPLEPDRFWESGAYGDGLFRTDDRGTSFRRLGDVEHLDFVSTDPTDVFRSTMLAGGHEKRVVYRSVDGGNTWADIATTLPLDVGFTAYPVVLNATTYLVGTYRADNAGVFRTEDGGTSWTRVHIGAVAGPPLITDDAIYWLKSNGAGVIFSTDNGVTFESFGVPTGGRPVALSVLPDGSLATYNSESILVSDDRGASWRALGPMLPFEPDGLAYSSQRDALFVWQFSCGFDDGGNPVLPGSIMKLDVDLTDG